MIQHFRTSFDGHERDGLASVKRGASTSRRDGTRRTRVLLLRLDLHPLESIRVVFAPLPRGRQTPLGRRSVHPRSGLGSSSIGASRVAKDSTTGPVRRARRANT